MTLDCLFGKMPSCMNRLPSPKELKQLYPVEKNDELFLQETRDNIQRILRGKKNKNSSSLALAPSMMNPLP